jgi:4-amino-4-deoxy-L-arabinose transferase-like glycosyltransferase
MTQPPARAGIFERHWTWWFMVAVLALVAAVRLRLLNFPLERDEGEYAYSGQLMLQGIPPYELAYNMKFPGTYAAYAVIMSIFGQTPAGIHFGVLLMTTATALMLFWLAKKILDTTAGIVAATSYAVLAASPSMLGLAGHATHFAAFFATAGLCVMWRARQNGNWLAAFLSGLLFGLAVLMKQHAVLIGAWAGISFAVTCFRKTEVPIQKRFFAVAACAAGMILPFLLCCLILWHAGVFQKFWFWTIDYARQYASVVPISEAPRFFWQGSRHALVKGFLVLPFAVAGMLMIWFDTRLIKSKLWIFGFGLISALSVCPDFYFRKHYFLLMLPGVGLLAGCAVSGLCKFSKKNHAHVKLRYWPVWIFALTLVVTIVTSANIWFLQSPTQAARTTYQADPFPEAETVAAFIDKNSPTDTRLAVLGSEPELYFLSHRHSATGYIYTYGLMEPQPFALQMQDEMIGQIETNAPEFIIFVDDRMSWWRYPDSNLKIFNWWDVYQTNYTLVAIADVLSSTNTVYVFGVDMIKHYGESRGSALEVYQRKTSPPITSNTIKKF